MKSVSLFLFAILTSLPALAYECEEIYDGLCGRMQAERESLEPFISFRKLDSLCKTTTPSTEKGLTHKTTGEAEGLLRKLELDLKSTTAFNSVKKEELQKLVKGHLEKMPEIHEKLTAPPPAGHDHSTHTHK